MSTRATVDLVSLKELQAKRDALRGVELFAYTQELRSVMVSPVHTCPPEETIRNVIQIMADKGVSCMVAVDETGWPIGILTERDVIRRIASVEECDPSQTLLGELMTHDPITLTPSDSVYRAMFLLSSRGIKHLPLVEEGQVVGIVTLRQLLKLRYPEPMMLIAGIAEARTAEDLREIKSRMPRLAATKLSMGTRAYDVVTMLSLINQDLHRRAFELAIEKHGEPPARCSLFLTGSHGRLENLLSTDQDYGIVIENVKNGAEANEYYADVSGTFTQWLETIGFIRCPGEVMGTNPVWRKSLANWKLQLDYWIGEQVKHVGRFVTVFYDAIPIWGEDSLFRDLNDHAFELISRHHEILRILHEEESGHRVPTGLLGRFITERKGEHRGEFDIKRSGLLFVVEGVRILALRHGVRETATLKRISKLVDGGHIASDDGEYFEGAYRFLLHFALDSQVTKAMEDEKIDTYVNPRRLSSRNQEMLRHAYKAVSTLQDVIASEFGQLVI